MVARKFSMKNKLMVPKILKVVLNMGLGADANDKKKLQNCIEDMSLISGQKPVVTKFKKSIFKSTTRDPEIIPSSHNALIPFSTDGTKLLSTF